MREITDIRTMRDKKLAEKEAIIGFMSAKLGRLLISFAEINFKNQDEYIDDILLRIGIFEILKEYGEAQFIQLWIKYLEEILKNPHHKYRSIELMAFILKLKTLIGVEQTVIGVQSGVVVTLQPKISE